MTPNSKLLVLIVAGLCWAFFTMFAALGGGSNLYVLVQSLQFFIICLISSIITILWIKKNDNKR